LDQVQPSASKNRLEPPETRPFEETHSSLGLYLVRANKSDAASFNPHVPKATPRPHSLQQFLSGIAATSDRAKPNQTHSIGENFTVALNHSYLNQELILRSLEAKNPTFKKSTAADGTQNLTEVSGIKLNFHTFGHDQKLDVRSIAINKETNGSTRFQLQVDNPLPPEVEKVFNAPSTLPLNFTMDARGRVSYPRDSEVLHSLSEHSNTTLPGLVLRDALSDAGDVAQFIEHNPAWVKNIMAPFMSRFGAYLKSDFDPSVVLNSAQPDKAAPTGKADQAQAPIRNSSTDSVKPRSTDALPATDASTFKIKGPGDYVETMQIEGRTRSFHVHVPASYDASKPMPMMLLAAGMSQTGKDVEEMFQANKLADKEGFIAVYPDSVNWFDVKDLRTWESGNGLVLPGQKASDVKFMGDIIEATKKQVNIDPQRIYMAGLSNGGMLTYSTAAALSGTLAGIGILSSTMSGKEPAPKEPLSMINIHGTADRIIPYEGMTDTPPVLTDVGVPVFQPAHFGTDYYRKLAGITAEPTVVKNGIETIERSSNPANGTAVEHITLSGVDHFLDDPAHRLQQVWDFFEAHPRPTPPNPRHNVEVKTSMAVEELTTVKQLQAAMKQRGVAGMEQDVDNIFDAALTISDGSISPSRIFDKITRSTHVAFNDPVNKFIQNTTLISKKNDIITIDRKVNADIPLHVSFGVGALKSIEIGKTSFVLAKANGYPELKNISGITLHAQVAGYNLDSKIQDITELPAGHNGANGRIYRATMENPLPGWMRTVLFSPGKFNVDLQFDPSGKPVVVNRSQTERQLLGKNPFVSGIADEAQDVANLYHHPGWLNGFAVASDAGITGGLTYAAYRFGGRAKLAATVGFIAAPMVIDLIRRNIS
jgi:polyhydroxybutyrate depolymerase